MVKQKFRSLSQISSCTGKCYMKSSLINSKLEVISIHAKEWIKDFALAIWGDRQSISIYNLLLCFPPSLLPFLASEQFGFAEPGTRRAGRLAAPGTATYISWKPGSACGGPRQPAPPPGQCPLASAAQEESAEKKFFEANLQVSAKGQDAGGQNI